MTGVIINNNFYDISTGSTKIEYSSMNGETIGYSMYGDEVPSNTLYTFTINVTPVDSVVTINGVQQSSITAVDNTLITWRVEKAGYITQTGSLTLNSDITETVTLQMAVTINAMPNGSTILINGE